MPIIAEHVSLDYRLAGQSKRAIKKQQAQAPREGAAVRDLSLTIEAGEFLGIIGHTGSGKSTLVQLLCGLLQPTAGRITVDGLDLADIAERRQARPLVGVVFQYPEYQLFEETVLADVSFGPKNMGLSPEEQTERARKALTMVGLDPDVFGSKSPFDLSGGEKRRAAIAGILAMEPRYLALDEPMAGLDPRGRKQILAMLEELRQTTGCAVIMVSHSMDDIVRCADRVLVMNGGRTMMLDTPGKVFSMGDQLRNMQLQTPQAVQLAELLRARGMDIPAEAVRTDEVAAAVLRCMEVGR